MAGVYLWTSSPSPSNRYYLFQEVFYGRQSTVGIRIHPAVISHLVPSYLLVLRHEVPLTRVVLSPLTHCYIPYMGNVLLARFSHHLSTQRS